jgi:prophage antirepressor-like protein
MLNLIVKKFEECSLSMVEKDGQMLFCAADLSTALGISESALRNKYTLLDEDEKTQVSQSRTAGLRAQNMVFVTEAGLYKLILWSRDSKQPGTFAHRFTRWVTHEVLPSLRETGKYEINQLRKRVESQNTELAEKNQELADQNEELLRKNQQLTRKNQQLADKNHILSVGVSNFIIETCGMRKPLRLLQEDKLKKILGGLIRERLIARHRRNGIRSNFNLTGATPLEVLRQRVLHYAQQFDNRQ